MLLLEKDGYSLKVLDLERHFSDLNGRKVTEDMSDKKATELIHQTGESI